jgi:hypothetical protein
MTIQRRSVFEVCRLSQASRKKDHTAESGNRIIGSLRSTYRYIRWTKDDDEATRLDHLPRFRRWRRRGAPPGGKQSDFSRSRWLAGRLAPSTNDQASALQMRRVSASMLSCWSRRSCESGSPMRRRQSSGRRDRRRRTAETSSKSRDENLPLDSRIAARARSVSHSKVAHERVATARGLGLGRSFNPLPWLPRGESGEASPR